MPKSTKTKKDFYMEDVHSLALKAMEVVEKGLKGYGITLTPEQEDDIYVPLEEAIEKHCVKDYRHHH